MATKPWITPNDVREYTEYTSVKNRSDAKLQIDIARAEQYIISATNNKFEEYETIPEGVKTAAILVAETYAFNACISSREMKSETFDDYSYTAVEAQTIDIGELDIAPLLEDYIKEETSKGVVLRMRKL